MSAQWIGRPCRRALHCLLVTKFGIQNYEVGLSQNRQHDYKRDLDTIHIMTGNDVTISIIGRLQAVIQ